MVQTGAGIYCSPAVEKDKVFVGDDMGRLTAYALKTAKSYGALNPANALSVLRP